MSEPSEPEKPKEASAVIPPGTPETITISTPEADSQLLGISVRAWLATMIVATVCGMSAFSIEVFEPLYTLSSLAIGFYFGQKSK